MSNTYVCIRDCEYGKGTFATRFIPAYTCILSESPLCTHVRDTPYAFTQFAHEKLLKLHHESSTDPVLDAFRMNAFQISYDTCAVYYRASRINHCCISNCHVNIHGDKLCVYTMQPIQRGDPITINYIDNYLLSYGIRAYRLKRSWNFECHCELCSDIPRRKLYDQFVYAGMQPDVDVVTSILERLRIPKTHVIHRKICMQVCSRLARQSNKSKMHIDFYYGRCIRGFDRDVREPGVDTVQE